MVTKNEFLDAVAKNNYKQGKGYPSAVSSSGVNIVVSQPVHFWL